MREINRFARELGARLDAGDRGVCDDPRWGERMRDLGFEMDCWHSFEETYGVTYGDPKALAPVLGNVDDLRVLCSGVFSQWRYINHWAVSDTTDDYRGLRMMLARLEELTATGA